MNNETLKRALAERDPQAHGGEPEVVAWAFGNPRHVHSSNIIAAHEFTPDAEHEDEWSALITLQYHHSVMQVMAVRIKSLNAEIDALEDHIAKKDAALKDCIDARDRLAQEPTVMIHKWKVLQELDAAIEAEQAKGWEAVDSMGIPASCRGALCSPTHHHPLCAMATTTPPAKPAREWVGLTDEEVNYIGFHNWDVRRIESKLREKNAGQPVVKEN